MSIIKVPIAVARFLVAIAVCAAIFVYTFVAGVIRLPLDAATYAVNDAAISFQRLHVNFPRFPQEREESPKFVDLSKKNAKPGTMK